MMNFVLMTISFTLAILLSMVVSFVIVTRPVVLKLYMKWVNKMTKDMMEAFDDVI